MRTLKRCVFLAPVLIAFTALAQTFPDLVPEGAYAELFLQSPKVSGNLLVGLSWDGPGGQFDPFHVRVRVPATVPTGKACVDVASKDGRYTAENLYAMATASGSEATIQSKTNYQKDLEKYHVHDIAVMIRTATSCDAPDFGSIIPAIVAPLEPGSAQTDFSRLVAYLNADPERISLSLFGPDHTALSHDVKCLPSGEGVRIAYSATCTIDLQSKLPPSGLVLRLATKERFRTITNDFSILIPQ